jgi:transcriptional regulator with GAF, ATPase, and Fis domain
VTEFIYKNTGAEATALYLPGSDGNFLLSASYGKSIGYKLETSFSHDFPTLNSGRPIEINLGEVPNQGDKIFPVVNPGFSYLYIVPLIYPGEILGVMVVCSVSKNAFSSEELSYLRILAGITALSMRENETINKAHFLYKAGAEVSADKDITEMMKSITNGVTEALKIKGCSIQLFDRNRERLINCISTGLSADFLEKGPVLDKKILSQILDGENIENGDAAGSADAQHKEAVVSEGIASTISVPLITGGEIIGVLKAYTSTHHSFKAEEIAFLEAYSSYGALIIRNAQRLNRIHTISLLGNIISTLNDLDEIYEVSAQHISEVMSVKASIVMTFDRDQNVLNVSAYHGVNDDYAEYIKIDQPNIINLVRMGEVFQVEDICSDDRVQFRDISILEGISSYLSVPLYCEGKVTGTIRALTSYRHKFSREEEEYLKAVSSFISLAHENVLAQNRSAFIGDILEEITSDPGNKTHLTEIINGLTEFLNIKACTLGFFTPSGKEITLEYAGIFDETPVIFEKREDRPDTKDFPAKIREKLTSGCQVMRIKGSGIDMHDALKDLGNLNQAFFYPIYKNQILTGAITLYTAGNQTLSPGELKFASSLVSLVNILSLP